MCLQPTLGILGREISRITSGWKTPWKFCRYSNQRLYRWQPSTGKSGATPIAVTNPPALWSSCQIWQLEVMEQLSSTQWWYPYRPAVYAAPLLQPSAGPPPWWALWVESAARHRSHIWGKADCYKVKRIRQWCWTYTCQLLLGCNCKEEYCSAWYHQWLFHIWGKADCYKVNKLDNDVEYTHGSYCSAAIARNNIIQRDTISGNFFSKL